MQLFQIKAVSFLLYNGLVFVIAAMAVGFFGHLGEVFSINMIAGIVYPGKTGFVGRMAILAVLDFSLLFIGRYVFVHRDISLPKGNKQYQEE